MARQTGRPRRSSEAQQADVLRRLAAGQSNREIAEAVFGDRRYYGRVERIRRTPATAEVGEAPQAERVELRLDRDAPPADAAYWRELVACCRRAVEQRLQRGEFVSDASAKANEHFGGL